MVGTPGPGCTVTFQADITDNVGVSALYFAYAIAHLPPSPLIFSLCLWA